jgi:hypothetical protein
MTSSTLLRQTSLAALVLAASLAACSKSAPPAAPANVFDTAEAAVKALKDAVDKSDVQRVMAVFGVNAPDVVDSSDLETARRNREVFAVAMNEGWRLEDQGDAKILVVGGEAWPFPVPLIREGAGWRWARAAVEALLRYSGESSFKLDMYMPSPAHYQSRGGVHIDVWLGDCKLGVVHQDEEVARQWGLPMDKCPLTAGDIVRVRLVSDNMLARSDRQLSFIVNGLGFDDATQTPDDAN